MNFENLKNQTIEEIRQELVNKDTFKAEIQRVETEIKRVESSLRQQGIYWLLGVAMVSTITVISSIWTMINFMLESLK